MIVYESKSIAGKFKKNIINITKHIKKDYYVGYRLTKQDIKSNYSKSYFGIIWDFLEPIAISIIFIFLYKSKSLNTENLTMSYSIYVIFGLLMWQIFNDTLLKTIELINSSKTLLSQLQVSAEALIMSVIFRMGFNSLFAIFTIIVFSIIMDVFNLLGALEFILLFPIVILAGLSIGLFLAPFNTINNDIGSFIKILLRGLFFTSAVLFPIPNAGLVHDILIYNPLVHIFENMRYIAIGYQVDWLVFFGITVCFFLLFLVSLYIFHISLKILSERA